MVCTHTLSVKKKVDIEVKYEDKYHDLVDEFKLKYIDVNVVDLQKSSNMSDIAFYRFSHSVQKMCTNFYGKW